MRTEGDHIKINEWLLPLSWLYGIGVKFRNWLFDVGLLKSRAYDIPIIAVGNITIGGSGKTPHVEYLINLLHDKMKVAVLSRGYKRKSKGYQLADEHTEMQEIGDEPFQMKTKFDDIYIAVDKKRCEGIDRLITDEKTKDVDVILLDDAFQHRYVKPGINILLIDYHRLIIYDKLLPAGRLRESEAGKARADIVIITKCPHDLKPMEYRVLTKALNLFPYQGLYFTTFEYKDMKRIFGEETRSLKELGSNEHVLLITGIASPQQLQEDLEAYSKNITPLTFGDHHEFKDRDIEQINEEFSRMPSPKVIITTEKDAARLQSAKGLSSEVMDNIYALPVGVKFMLGKEEDFNKKITSYVRKNSRNSILVKNKDEHKPEDRHRTGDRPRTISFRDN
ncbi:MAG: tetraacyldisaccharide 4'-kinase [Prevotella sp.]|nr:tetraacyldisaccharide 4'-kinase [Prevotella sp.]